MKANRIVIIIVGLVLTSVALSGETDAPSIPGLDQVQGIGFYSGIWNVRLFTNGMAMLICGEGAQPMEGANSLDGSFPFEEIYNYLIPFLKEENEVSLETMTVSLSRNDIHGNFTGKVFYIDDKDAIRYVMYGFRDKVVPNHRIYFEGLLGKYPLVPGDEPTPFAYDDEAYAIAYRAKWGIWPWDINGYKGKVLTNFMISSVANHEKSSPFITNKTRRASAENETKLSTTEEQPQSAENEPLTPMPVNADDSTQSNLLLYLVICTLLFFGVVFHFVKKKKP